MGGVFVGLVSDDLVGKRSQREAKSKIGLSLSLPLFKGWFMMC